MGGWCGPGNDARDKNGNSWEDPTSFNHKYSAKFVPKECLGIKKGNDTPKEDDIPKKDDTPNCKNYPLSNNGRCGCRFRTYCKAGFCSRWGWCGPGNDARDKNGNSWEDPTSYNHKYSAKFVPKQCLDTPKGVDTPKDDDVPKKDDTPKDDDTPKEDDIPK